MKHLFLTLLLISNYNVPPKDVPSFTWQEIGGRDELTSENTRVRRPVYRAKVSPNWVRIDPSDEEFLTDTTKPLATFMIDEIRITVHSFPSDTLENRIAPIQQVERWKKQLENEDATVQPICRGGFVGLFFEAKDLLAWSMQLDIEHYQTLSLLANSFEQTEHFKQMKADYTIKVSGPSHLIEKHRDVLFLFANSFELIQPIPLQW